MGVSLGLYTHVLGAIEAGGFVYLFYQYRDDFERNPVLVFPVFGLLLFVVIETVMDELSAPLVHAGHAVSAASVAVGLSYLLVKAARNGASPGPYLLGVRPNWMTEMDDRILSFLDASGTILTPAVVAYNLEYSRESVNRHLRKLERRGLVERVDRGKYRIGERNRTHFVPFSRHSVTEGVKLVTKRLGKSINDVQRTWFGTN